MPDTLSFYTFGFLKVLALIFAILTASLSILPCDDELFVSSVGDTAITNHDHDGHNHEDGEDFCSPFCVCAITNIEEINANCVVEPVVTGFQAPNFLYLAPSTLESTSNVFQPPRV
jgi:hypothetical protein